MKLAVTDLISSGSRALRVRKNDPIGATRSIHLRLQMASTLGRMMGEVSAVRTGSVLASVLLMGASVACTELDPETDNCVSVGPSDCPRPPPPETGPNPFWCLSGEREEFVPMSPAPPFVNYVVPIVDSANPQGAVALPNLTIRACLGQDPVCDPTSPARIPTIVSQVPGRPPALTSVLVPFGVALYLVLEAEGYLRTEYYFGGPMVGAPPPIGTTVPFEVPEALAPVLMVPAGTMLTIPVVQGEPIPMVRTDVVDPLFEEFGRGATRVDNTGIVALRMIDCNGNRVSDVSLDMGSDLGDGFGFILTQNNVPSRSSESSLAGPTVPGLAGGAGFANVPPGNYQPVGVLEDGSKYGGLVGIRVRANGVTNGEIRPFYDYGR